MKKSRVIEPLERIDVTREVRYRALELSPCVRIIHPRSKVYYIRFKGGKITGDFSLQDRGGFSHEESFFSVQNFRERKYRCTSKRRTTIFEEKRKKNKHSTVKVVE